MNSCNKQGYGVNSFTMRAILSRDMCATCKHWNGPREAFEDYVSFDINSKGMCLNKKCRSYGSCTSALKSYCFDWLSLKNKAEGSI